MINSRYYKVLTCSTLQRKTKNELIEIIRYLESKWSELDDKLIKVANEANSRIASMKEDCRLKLEETEKHWLDKYVKACAKNEDRSSEYKELVDAIIKQPAISKPKLKLSFNEIVPEKIRDYETYKDINQAELKESIDKLAKELKETIAENIAESKKKTCWNCAHFHGVLNSPDPEDFYHVHNYCDAWDASLTCPLNSRLCEFLDMEIEENLEQLTAEQYDYFLNDDLEIGKAGCYRFKDNEEASQDEKMRENFEHDKALALKIIEIAIEKSSDSDEIDYYQEWKKEIENMRFED